jgi:coenzyme F420-dependent glucose-6-phosphate dehydrogenase
LTSEIVPRGTVSYSINLDIADAVTLREYAVLAEKAGFTAVWAADHFHPWFHSGAHETQAWIWMTSLLERTQNVPVGTGVTCPIFRYHPAIIAQAFATMQALYGKRVFLGVGAGEAINEVSLGFRWPGLGERRERVVEAVKIIRKLWAGEAVNFTGKYFTLKDANLYMKADMPIFMAASGPKMAEIVGELGDGFVTIKGADYAKQELFPALEKGARKAGRTIQDIPKVIEIDLSYDQDYDKALAPLRTQAGPLLPEMFTDPIHDPREVERRGKAVTDEELTKAYVVGTAAEDFIRPVEAAFNSGFDHVYLASLSPDERAFIELCRKHLLPHFAAKSR